MRRGLLSWSHDEVPPAVFEGRIARAQGAMKEAGLDALLIYTNFPRPAAVSYLTHFVPYWNQCMLVVLPTGLPHLLVGLSKRVGGWIQSTAHVEEVICTPRIGAETQGILGKSGATKVGMVELAKVPMPILAPLIEAGETLSDATELFMALRNPADEVEIAQATHAAAIAKAALMNAAPHKGEAAMLTAIERDARLAGAEEILMDVAEDLDRDPRLRRAQGDFNFGDRYAIRVSVAYKGNWVRYGRSFEKGQASSAHVAAVEAAIAQSIPSLGDGGNLSKWPAKTSMATSDVVLEGAMAGTPLLAIEKPAPGAVVSLGMTLSDTRGCWLVSEPVLLAGEKGGDARLLAE